MKYTIEFELPDNMDEQLEGNCIRWFWYGHKKDYEIGGTATPIKPKIGKWKRHPEYREFDVCTVCGIGCKRRDYGIMPDTDGTPAEWMTEYSYQYCPNCGAKMEVTE